MLKQKDLQIYNDNLKMLSNNNGKKHIMNIGQIIKLKSIQVNQYSALSMQKYKNEMTKNSETPNKPHSLSSIKGHTRFIKSFDLQWKKADTQAMQSSQKIILREIKHMFRSISRPKKLEELFEGIDLQQYPPPKKHSKSTMKQLPKIPLPTLDPNANVFITSNDDKECIFHLPTIYKSRTQ
jgi:hypothetical protein